MKRIHVLVITIFFLVYLVPLGVRALVIPDETRYAEIPREMLASGDWVVPHLNGLRYFEKPVLGYWLNAAAMWLFGENAFAVRLPSAVAVGLTALLLFLLVRKFSDDYLTALLATAVFLLSFEVLAIGVFCVLDSVLSLFVTAAILSLFFALREENTRKKMILLVLAGMSCGLAFLAKGFLALVIPMIVIIPFVLRQGQFKSFLRTSWAPIITAVLVVLPWSVMIHLREPDFWHYFFWTEHVSRFFSPEDGQHNEPFWFFVPMILGGALPWTILLPAIVSGLKRIPHKDPLFRFAMCWLLFPFLFFSACRGKLGTYILPCFPPLAILVSLGLRQYLAAGKTKLFGIGSGIVLALVIGLTGTLIFFHLALPDRALYGRNETWKWILLTIGLLTYAVLLILARRETQYKRKLALFCIGQVLVMFSTHFIVPNQFKVGKMPGEFLSQHSSRIQPDTIIVVSDAHLVPAVCWFYHRDNVYIFDTIGEFQYGLSYEYAKARSLDVDQFRVLIGRNSGTRGVTLISSALRYEKSVQVLPRPLYEDIHSGFAFAEYAAPAAAGRASLPD